MTAQSNHGILNAALEYADMGFSVIPVHRETKRPYISWAEFQTRRPDRAEIESWWEKFPDANVAIVCGSVSGILCVDGDGPEGLEWIQNNLPATTVYSQTARGIHAVYRLPRDAVIRTRSKIVPQVDIRGEGGYFVAPPSVHHTGHQYRWIFLGNGWDDLPEYAPTDVTGSEGNLNLDLGNIAPPVLTRFGGVPEGARNDTLTRLAGRWIAKGLDPDEVYELAVAWNAKNVPPLEEAEVRRTVESVYKTHERNNRRNVHVPGPERTSLPKAFLSPGGLMQDIAQYIEASSPASHTAFNTIAAAVTLGAVAGQKVMTESGLRTNLYVIALAYSGVGKDAPHDAVPNLLMPSRAHEILGPNTLTSDAALLKRLSTRTRENQLCFLDEIAFMLKALKNPNSPAVGIPALLMQLWSGTDRGYLKTYASGDEIVVRWHHLSLYGTSTPERFWESITPGELTDGFLARLLVVDVADEAPKPRTQVTPDVPEALVKAIDSIYTIRTDMKGGNLEGIPRPHVVRLADEAGKIFENFSDTYHRKKNAHRKDNDGSAAIYGRAAENAWKLALIHAVSKNGPNVVTSGIGPDSMEWAIGIVEWCVEHTVRQVRLHVAANEWHAWEQKILRLIRDKATEQRPGLTKREILKNIWGLSVKAFDQLIDTMNASGKVVTITYTPRKGPATELYCLPGEEDNAV